MISWKLERRKIKELKKHSKNPRQLTKEQRKQLGTSIWAYGLIDKPVIDQDNQIIGGHQRVQILKEMKIDEVECWVPDRNLDQKEIDELNIRLNKNTGTWDWDLLANEWEVADLLQWGFEEKDITQDFALDEKAEKPQKKSKTCPHCGGDL